MARRLHDNILRSSTTFNVSGLHPIRLHLHYIIHQYHHVILIPNHSLSHIPFPHMHTPLPLFFHHRAVQRHRISVFSCDTKSLLTFIGMAACCIVMNELEGSGDIFPEACQIPAGLSKGRLMISLDQRCLNLRER